MVGKTGTRPKNGGRPVVKIPTGVPGYGTCEARLDAEGYWVLFVPDGLGGFKCHSGDGYASVAAVALDVHWLVSTGRGW